MNLAIWQSPAAGTLGLITDATAKRADRIKAIRDLGASWGADAQRVFAEVLLKKDDDVEVKKEIATLLRARPTDENFRILVEALRAAEDQRLKNHLSKALRVRNPRGPVIEEDDDDAIVTTKTRTWAMWGELLK